MQFVKTFKRNLSKKVYNSNEVLTNEFFNRDWYLAHPTPEAFTVNPYESVKAGYRGNISKTAFQVLATWYIRGTSLTFTNYGESITLPTISRPRPEWGYSFVDEIPNYYLRLNKTTSEKAYQFGKELIEACATANKIPFDVLESTYNTIMEACLDLKIYAQSPNRKTWLEAMSNKILREDLAALGQAPEAETNLSDEELLYYAKVFDINVPKWFVKVDLVKTEHGYAKCPNLTMSDETFKPQYDNSGNRKTYDGNYNDDLVPISLMKETAPIEAATEAARLQLITQVNFYLNLPIEEQKLFMTANFAYCEHCKDYYEIRLGCLCATNQGFDDDNAYQHYMATREFALSQAV